MQPVPLLVHFNDVRIFDGEPRRRRSRRSSEDHANIGAMKNVDRPLQPVKIEFPLRGFHQHPRKFCDAHISESGLGDPARVFFPQRLGRLVGVVIDAEQQRDRRRRCAARCDLCPERQAKTGSAQHCGRSTHKVTSIDFCHEDFPFCPVSIRPRTGDVTDECGRQNLHPAQDGSSFS